MVVGPDDSIYVLRRLTACPSMSCVRERLVTRFRPNGSIDGSFGSGGTTSAFGPRDSFASGDFGSLALGLDGTIVVAAVEKGDLILARLNPNGSLDGSFGQGGVAKASLGIEASHVRLAVQADGRITVAADAAFAYGASAVAVARYTPQGAPDPTFNGGVPVVTSLGSGLGGLGLSGDKTVVAGPRCCQLMGNAVHMARFDAAGSFDSSFGSRGQLFVDDVAKGAAVGSLLVLRNGRIVVVGAGTRDGKAFVLRLLPSGRLDAAFGRRGIAYVEGKFSSDIGATVDGHRRLLVGGTARNRTKRGEGGDRLALLRRLPDGRRDRTFGGGALVWLHSSTRTGFVAIGVQSHDRPVVLAASGGCFRTCPSPVATIVRYLGGASRARCLGEKATIVGIRNADTLVGTPRPDVIAALAGNDRVRGRGGDDLICGGRGNDRLVGGGGKDRIVGGAGRNHVKR